MIYGEFELIVINHCRAYLDCHLMVTNPLDYVEPLGKAGASGFTFHIETSKGWSCHFSFILSVFSNVNFFFFLPTFYITLFLLSWKWFLLADNWKELIQNIKSHGMRPGVSIKPGTSVEEVYPLVCIFPALVLIWSYLHSCIFLSSFISCDRVSWVFCA